MQCEKEKKGAKISYPFQKLSSSLLYPGRESEADEAKHHVRRQSRVGKALLLPTAYSLLKSLFALFARQNVWVEGL